jgi:hypothetical protein
MLVLYIFDGLLPSLCRFYDLEFMAFACLMVTVKVDLMLLGEESDGGWLLGQRGFFIGQEEVNISQGFCRAR